MFDSKNMKKITKIKSIIILISALLLVGSIIIFLFTRHCRGKDLPTSYQNLLKEANEITMTYYKTDGSKPVSRKLTEAEVDLLKSIQFIPEPKEGSGISCACKWNPVFTINGQFFRRCMMGVGCSLTIEGCDCLPPGDHFLTKNSKIALNKWLKGLGITDKDTERE